MPQESSQRPAAQTCPAAQVVPHMPQFARSTWASTQRLPHRVSPTGQVSLHAPPMQTSPAAQALSHMPQWAASPCVSTQRGEPATVQAV